MKQMRVLVIAEIGVNHNGKYSNAIKLIDAAKKSGANFVKFQLFNPEKLVTEKAEQAPYQKKNFSRRSQKEMLVKYILSEKNYIKLYNYSKKKKIGFLATPFDRENLAIISKLNLEYIKISSGDLDNIPLLRNIIKLKKKIILSTGMADCNEISKILNFLKKNGHKKEIYLLHCVSSYPTELKFINLKSILYLKDKFKINIGLSDHTTSTIIPALSTMLGAKIIEKHITLNKKMKGPDHAASLNPTEFKQMVKNIRDAELALGRYHKKPNKLELQNKKFSRRSIYTSQIIKKGDVFTENNLITKRPMSGISSIHWDKFINKKAKKNLKKNHKIQFRDAYENR